MYLYNCIKLFITLLFYSKQINKMLVGQDTTPILIYLYFIFNRKLIEAIQFIFDLLILLKINYVHHIIY